MLHFADDEVEALLEWKSMIDTLDQAFQRGAKAPAPAFRYRGSWIAERQSAAHAGLGARAAIGPKTVTVFAGNLARSESSVNVRYLLLSATIGRLEADFAGDALKRNDIQASPYDLTRACM